MRRGELREYRTWRDGEFMRLAVLDDGGMEVVGPSTCTGRKIHGTLEEDGRTRRTGHDAGSGHEQCEGDNCFFQAQFYI